MLKAKKSYADHRALARQFEVGDTVLFPILTRGDSYSPIIGLVTAVLDKIGMVDVETPYGNIRIEPDQIVKGNSLGYDASYLADTSYSSWELERAHKVASAYKNKYALYWKEVGRVYTPTRQEISTGNYTCPKCCGHLTKSRYKKNEILYACPACLWMIRPDDILEPLPPISPHESDSPGGSSCSTFDGLSVADLFSNSARNVVYRVLYPE